MQNLRTAIAGLLALFVASAAVAQQFPTVPSNTVIGRLGGGTTGPSQAIPFATLATQLSGTSTIQPALVAGAVDNTTVLNAAITRCTSLGGGTILIPVGTWQYATGLTINSQGCNLVGFGRSSKLTYTGTGVGLTISGGLDSLYIRDLTLAASSSSATNLKIRGVNSAISIQGVKFTGGSVQLLIDGAPSFGSYGIDVANNNFEGNTTVTKSISIAPSTAGYAQAITIRQNEFSGFNQAIYHVGSDAISIFQNRIERHFAGTGAAIHTETSNGVNIIDNYFEDENSNKPFIESGASVGALTVISNKFFLNVGGGTHTSASALKTTATASLISFSYNYMQSLSAASVLGNVVDTGASKIFGRANVFNIGTNGAAYGFASTATSANVDIDGTKVIAGTFTSAQQQVGVGRMALDFSNASGYAPLQVGSSAVGNGTSSRVLYDNGGVLGEYTQAQVGNLVATVANTWSATQTYTAQIVTTFGTPTIASGACGTGSNGTISGANQSGIITIGASATTTCTISFSTTIVAPNACLIFPGNAAAAAAATTVARVGTPSTTQWVITGAVLASTVYSYICL